MATKNSYKDRKTPNMSQDILFEQRGSVGLVTLNRVKALNALSIDMVKALAAQLVDWQHDDTIKAVILTSASEKAFSAGGDIRALYEGRDNPPFDFFWHEYRLNRYIHRYPKPYISLINGIVMGGGVGISMHGKYVVGGERIMFAMPEVGIGFFPDVGGSHILPRMTGASGTYCAMTGERLKQGDCAAFGLTTHSIDSSYYDDLIARISDGENAETVLASYHQFVVPKLDEESMASIHENFAADNVADIVKGLEADDREFSQKTLAVLKTKSPTSIHVAFEQVQRGRDKSFEECMAMEYRIVHRILQDDDFYEGVRATIIDKDGRPSWNPMRLEDVQQERIEKHFTPLPNGELEFDAI